MLDDLIKERLRIRDRIDLKKCSHSFGDDGDGESPR